MSITRKRLLIELRDLFLFMVIGSTISYLTCSNCRSSLPNYLVYASFSTLVWFFLWKGNTWLGDYVSKKISWTEFPFRRMIIGTVISVLYTILATVGLMSFYEWTFKISFGSGYAWTVYSSIIVTIIISLIMHSRAFLLHWREAEIEKERFKKESIAAQYESLKNQVNPHFLFNSLNALTNLVYENQDRAAQFIKQLSRVYRYVLDTKDREVVPLKEELDFIDSYIFLEQIRFGEKLIIENSLSGKAGYVAPLALQMLIENAIKHNIMAEHHPLTIKLYEVQNYLVVSNNLNIKNRADSPGVGLENIKNRYKFLTDKPVEVIEDKDLFQVRLPVISKPL